jgi:hypothetical protein
MKRIEIPLLAVLAGFTLMCGTKTQPKAVPEAVPVVQEIKDSIGLYLPDVLKQKKEIFLSGIASSISYIPLETTNKFLIGEKTVQLKPCGEFLFVSEHGKPVGVFDRSGKFIRTIGAIGRGPGEYNFDFNFWPDLSSRSIYIWNADVSAIMAFSFEGKYLKNVVPEIKAMSFAPLGNGQFITWTFMQKEQDGKFYRLAFHDETGQTKKRIYEPKKKYDFSRGIAIMSPLFTPTYDGFLYNTWEDDMICKAKSDGSFNPVLTWQLGNLKIPFNPSTDFARYDREKGNYIMDVNGCESPSAWYIKFYYKNQLHMTVYDKAKSIAYLVSNPDTAQQGVINDIDGGPSFWPFWDNEGGKSFVRLVNAMDMIDYQKAGLRSKIQVKNPDQANRLKELVAKLNENSNPVLMLVDLK